MKKKRPGALGRWLLWTHTLQKNKTKKKIHRQTITWTAPQQPSATQHYMNQEQLSRSLDSVNEHKTHRNKSNGDENRHRWRVKRPGVDGWWLVCWCNKWSCSLFCTLYGRKLRCKKYIYIYVYCVYIYIYISKMRSSLHTDISLRRRIPIKHSQRFITVSFHFTLGISFAARDATSTFTVRRLLEHSLKKATFYWVTWQKKVSAGLNNVCLKIKIVPIRFLKGVNKW